MATFGDGLKGAMQNMALSHRHSQRDIFIERFIETSPGLSNKRFRLWLAPRSQSNLTRLGGSVFMLFVSANWDPISDEEDCDTGDNNDDAAVDNSFFECEFAECLASTKQEGSVATGKCVG